MGLLLASTGHLAFIAVSQSRHLRVILVKSPVDTILTEYDAIKRLYEDFASTLRFPEQTVDFEKPGPESSIG